MTENQYYQNELKKLDHLKLNKTGSFQVHGWDVNTKVMSLNDKSASELVKWLKQNYNITNE